MNEGVALLVARNSLLSLEIKNTVLGIVVEKYGEAQDHERGVNVYFAMRSSPFVGMARFIVLRLVVGWPDSMQRVLIKQNKSGTI